MEVKFVNIAVMAPTKDFYGCIYALDTTGKIWAYKLDIREAKWELLPHPQAEIKAGEIIDYTDHSNSRGQDRI